MAQPQPRRLSQTKAKSEEKPVLRGAAEAIACSLAEGLPLEGGRPVQQLRDALLAENPDFSQGAFERCASLRSGLVLALREELRSRPVLAPLVTDDPAPKVRIEVRQTAGRCLSSEAFTVGRMPECDVQTSGDCTVSRLQFVVVSLPGCVLVVDCWSCGGTRIVRRSGSGRLTASLPSRRTAFALPHGERVIFLIGSRTTVTLGPAAKDATEGAALPVDLPQPRSALTFLAPPGSASGILAGGSGAVARPTSTGTAVTRPASACTAAGEGSPKGNPAATSSTAPAAAAADSPTTAKAAAVSPAVQMSAQVCSAPPSMQASARPAQLMPAPAHPAPGASVVPPGTTATAGLTAATGAASAGTTTRASLPSAATAPTPAGKPRTRARLSVAPELLSQAAAPSAATAAAAAPSAAAAAAAAAPAAGPASEVPAWAAAAPRPAADAAPARWSRCLAAVRAGVRMQQAVAARERLRWRCRAARRAGLLTGEQCAGLEERLRPSEAAADEVRDVLDGLGVPPAPDEVLAAPSAAWTCGVCQDTHRAKGWRCPFRHRFCRKCMVKWAEERSRPSCPMEGCGYRLGEHDLEDLRVSPQRLEAFRTAAVEEGLLALQQEEGSQATVFRCSGSRCGAAVVLGANEARRCWTCACGAPPSCTGCGATPYHHHARCEDVQPLRARWLAWLQGGREAYRGLQRRAAREATAQQRALREAMARQAELERDEKWKAEHCRLCPKCRRAVEKIDGCNTMVCGQNTHGGNRQPGCGHRFSWRDARPYKPRAGFARRMATAMLARQGAVGGRGVRHLFTQCGLCGSDGKCIVGPRFRCIHCPSFNCCLKCEERLAEEHQAGHVFEIMFEDELDWARLGVELPKGSRARIRRRATLLAAAEAEASGAQGGRKRKHEEDAGLEGVIRGQRRGRYLLELPDGSGVRHVEPAALQPLLTQRQAERLLANVPAAEVSRVTTPAASA